MATILAKNIPDKLKQLRQWVLWRYEIRDGKLTKVPYTAVGYRASVTNPEHWSTFEHVLAIWRAQRVRCDGIGFVFATDDGYSGADLDNIYPSDAADCAPWAEDIIQRFGDTYAEESPSGKGLKIWVRARAPRCGRWIIEGGAIELYDRNRFFAMTGRSNGIVVVTDHQQDIELLVANLDRFSGRSGDHSDKPARTIGQKIPAGQRHPMLVSLAGTLWRRGLDLEEIEVTLMAVNQRRCDPQHSADHVRKLV